MKKYFNKKAKLEFFKIFSSYEKIEVSSGQLRFNYKCHFNAVHDAVNNVDSRIAMCVVVRKNTKMPIIHFINVDENNNFIDNTFGYWSFEYTYYFIRFLDKSEFVNIDKIFGDFRRDIRKKLSFWVRIFSTYNC